MIELLIGVFAGVSIVLFYSFTKSRNLHLRWWKWGIITAGFIYSVFTLEMITAFLKEGSSRGALVIGIVMGFGAVVWGVLIYRFFLKKPNKENS